MIFLEQITNQILREEGQMVISLSDLGISWEDIEQIFIGVYEQAKRYISIYDWTEDTLGLDPKQLDISHIRHLTYKAYYQRFMPDVPDNYWEYNPYTKKASSLMNTNFAMEVAKYPTLDNLDYTLQLKNIKKDKYKNFKLPFTPSDDISIMISNSTTEFNIEVNEVPTTSNLKNDYLDGTKDCICNQNKESSIIEIIGDANGEFNPDTLSGKIKFNSDYDSIDLNLISKYVGIKELDMGCELFYIWYKAALLTTIGAVKKQLDLSGVGLPFDFNQDGLLERGRQLMDKVEDLKGNKSHWSNF